MTSVPRVLLLCLAAAIPAWWAGLFASETFRGLFATVEAWPALRDFFWADLGLAAITATAALRRPSSVGFLAAACGAWGYATLWALRAALSGAVRPLGVASMIAGVIVALAASRALVSSSRPDQH